MLRFGAHIQIIHTVLVWYSNFVLTTDYCSAYFTLNTLPPKWKRLVEQHPQLHSKLERMLEDVFNTLEPKVSSAAIRKQKE